MKTLTRYLLPPLSLIAMVLVIGTARASYIARTDNVVTLPTLTVTYFDQPYKNFVAYRADLVAPEGTEIQIRNGGLHTIENEDEPYTFVLTHILSSSLKDNWPPNNRIGDSFVESVMLSNQLQETEAYTLIPNSGTRLESFAAVERNVYFVSSGTYHIGENEKFVLSRIDGDEFYFTILTVPR